MNLLLHNRNLGRFAKFGFFLSKLLGGYELGKFDQKHNVVIMKIFY